MLINTYSGYKEQMYIHTHVALGICIIYVHFIVSFSQLIIYHTPNPKLNTKKRLPFPPLFLKGKTPFRCSCQPPGESRGIRPRHMMLWVEWELKTWIQRRRSIDVTSHVRWHVFWAKDPLTTHDQVLSGRFVEKSWMIATNGSLKNGLVGEKY